MKKVTVCFCDDAGDNSSHALLDVAVRYILGEKVPPRMEKTPMGKPFFPDMPNLHFSISHSENVWICAFANSPVGCDVQFPVRLSSIDRIAARFFHPDEMEKMKHAPDRDLEFYKIWTRKEAIVKYHGNGLSATAAKINTYAHLSPPSSPIVKDMILPTKNANAYAAIAFVGDFEYSITAIDVPKNI